MVNQAQELFKCHYLGKKEKQTFQCVLIRVSYCYLGMLKEHALFQSESQTILFLGSPT